MNDSGAIIINYIGRKGGGTLVSYEMAKALVECGEKVIPILSNKIENKKLWDALNCQKIIYLDAYDGMLSLIYKSLFFSKYRKQITKTLINERIKAVYTPMVGFWTKKINDIFKNTKKIMICHDPTPHSGKGRLVSMSFMHMFKDANIVLVHSKKFVLYLKDKYSDVRYFPLPPHHMYRSVKDKKKAISYDPNKINYLFFGRIDKYKGIEVLLSAYKRIEEKFERKSTLTIAGSGNLSKSLDKIDKLSTVSLFNRWIKDEEVESFFQGDNIIVVCPYKDATQSGVVSVAYDYRVPVIGTKTGGLEEQIEEGRTGFLVSPNSSKELYMAMVKFLKKPEIINDMKLEIEKHVSNVSWKANAEALINMI